MADPLVDVTVSRDLDSRLLSFYYFKFSQVFILEDSPPENRLQCPHGWSLGFLFM